MKIGGDSTLAYVEHAIIGVSVALMIAPLGYGAWIIVQTCFAP